MDSCALVFPHQLFDPHPAIAPGREGGLGEDPLVFGDPAVGIGFHAQKRILHRASMRAWADHMRSGGHRVRIVDWKPGLRSDELLAKALPNIKEVWTTSFDDYLLERRVERWADANGITVNVLPSPGFLTPEDWADDFFRRHRRPIMGDFYREQRKRLGVLLEPDGSPAGGKWSHAAENRKRLPAHTPVPDPWRRPAGSVHVREAVDWVGRTFSDSLGNAEGFSYPVTHKEARDSLRLFLETRFAGFGDFEDAIDPRHRVLFHSVLTPALNIGLLTPDEVLREALAHAERRRIPLNSLEGFVRQVIGWREFMRQMYVRRGVGMRTRNFWGFESSMPAAFYNASTGIPPVDECIRRALETGYCHHIERLMVLGGFMLLCRIHPDAVHRWFMELFIDAYDWVMVPNVHAMSQFADGGSFTTKPYLSGSNYILKMSTWKRGPWCEIWDGLYWSFIADHAEFFASNPRLLMMARLVAKMPATTLDKHRRNAQGFLGKHGLG